MFGNNSEIEWRRQLAWTCSLEIVFSGNLSPLIIFNLVETRPNDNVPWYKRTGSPFDKNMRLDFRRIHFISFQFPKAFDESSVESHLTKINKRLRLWMQNLSVSVSLKFKAALNDSVCHNWRRSGLIRPSECYCVQKLRGHGRTFVDILVATCKPGNVSFDDITCVRIFFINFWPI